MSKVRVSPDKVCLDDLSPEQLGVLRDIVASVVSLKRSAKAHKRHHMTGFEYRAIYAGELAETFVQPEAPEAPVVTQ